MTRQAWLSISIAALFAVGAPVCALACLAHSGSTAMTTSGPHAHTPCSEDESAAPERPAPGERACDCDGHEAVRANIDFDRAFGFAKAPVFVLRVVSPSAANASPRSARLYDVHQSLPSPDILRLKSTLLL